MISMRTITGRFAIVVVLAALASLITGASLAQASPRPGTQAVGVYQLSEPAMPKDYGSRAPFAPTLRNAQPLPAYYGSQAPFAPTLRNAQPLPAYYGSQAPFAPTIGREQPLPRYYGSTSPYAAQGLREQSVSVGASNSFNWGDAAIGAAVGLALALVAVGGFALRRNTGREATQG
jgi:hypothetical protein